MLPAPGNGLGKAEETVVASPQPNLGVLEELADASELVDRNIHVLDEFYCHWILPPGRGSCAIKSVHHIWGMRNRKKSFSDFSRRTMRFLDYKKGKELK